MTQAATTNSTPACVDDHSATATQMRAQTDPYPSEAESLATSLIGELERLRYVLSQLSGRTFWYQDPVEGGRPNLLLNASAEAWSAGTSSAPDSWTLSGAGATVARNATAAQVKHATYSADVVRVGADATLSQAATVRAGGTGYFRSRTYTLAVWVRVTVASRARIALYDGVGSTESSYHTGGGSYERLSVTRTLSATATELTARLLVDTADTTAQFDAALLAEGYLGAAFTPNFVDQPGVPNSIGARVFNTLAISIADATATAVTFDSERFDTSDFHSTVSNTSRLTIPVAGVCHVSGHLQWAANATGTRRAAIRLSGSTLLAEQRTDNSGASVVTGISVSTLYRFAATDYLELLAEQNSGGALNVNTAGNTSPEFAVYCLGP